MPLKNEILEQLELARGSAQSGAQLAERFSVSRTAVWKAVNALKADGHDIVTVGKRGYLLTENSDRLSVSGITAFLADEFCDVRIFVYGRVDSTNDEARKFSARGENCRAVFISEQQTAGHTRNGGTFYSPFGTGLYLSALVYADRPIEDHREYAAFPAEAVKKAVRRVTGISTDIQPPGDLYIGERKVCGISVNADVDVMSGIIRRLIVGVGIHITTEDFPDEQYVRSGSLGKATVRCRLAAEIIKELYTYAENVGSSRSEM